MMKENTGKPVIAFICSQDVYESDRWKSKEVAESDPRVRVVYFVVDKYPDNTPYIVMYGKLFKEDRVVVVSAIDDPFVISVVNEEVARRTVCPTGFQLFVPHLRSDKESSHRRERDIIRSIEYSDEDQIEISQPTPIEEDDEEIYTAHHCIRMLSSNVNNTYFLEPHSNVLTTRSKSYDIMIVFVQFVIESLMIRFENLRSRSRSSAIVINFPDSGAKHRYKHIESLMQIMKFDSYYMIAVDKVRTGTNKDSKTKSTLMIDSEQLEELQAFEDVYVLTVDDLTQSGSTLIDAAFLTRDKIVGAREKTPNVTSILCPFHFHPVRDVTGRFQAAERFDELIEKGDIHAVYTSDSIPEVTCKLPKTSRINITPMVHLSTLGIMEKENIVY